VLGRNVFVLEGDGDGVVLHDAVRREDVLVLSTERGMYTPCLPI
jgi:hypothetical protein